MPIDLTELVCLVTGADEGIGNAIVNGFLKRGAKVAAGLLDAKKNEQAVRPAFNVQMDVTQVDQVNSAIAKTVERFGRIDVLINNAGIYPSSPADEMTFADWQHVLDVNLNVTWRCCEAVIPQFKRQKSGVIINVGSITFREGLPNLSHYITSKGGIVGLTRAPARDLGTYGVRVNCIHPGAIQTPVEARNMEDPKEALARLNQKQCLAGRITPADIEPAFAFLASEESRAITGQCLTVDKGWIHE